MWTLRKSFYPKLAWANVRRNKITYLPYMIATAVISGVNLLIAGLITTDTLHGVPAGETAQSVMAFGMVVFIIFSFCFMVYINNFLISRRKREFGLYGILGLEKRHVGRVLVWENLFVLGLGVIAGVVLGLVFGQLLFLILMKLLHLTPGSTFHISTEAYLIMLGLFLAVFVFTSLVNLVKMRLASPIELMQAERKGQKDSKLMIPVAVLGCAALCAAYYFAWTIANPGTATGVFFLLALLVIFATFALFTAGSIVFLKLLRSNKGVYYRSRNFVAIAGMFQRMKQNARSLATICILSTMLIVTVSGTLSLYLGSEESNRELFPYDVSVSVPGLSSDSEELQAIYRRILELAEENGYTITADPAKITHELGANGYAQNNYIPAGQPYLADGTVFHNTRREELSFDTDADAEEGIAFCELLQERLSAEFPGAASYLPNIYDTRLDGYGLYGGLLFLGVFFGVLFLAVTVLIIYFKQVTEGIEDKERFAILQQVGMDERQVKDTINRQILWVFFLPLATTLVHMLFASKIMNRMLMLFSLNDLGLVLGCIGGTCLVFALLYLVVFRLTARTYYRIVKR